jgi:hypothetical protein
MTEESKKGWEETRQAWSDVGDRFFEVGRLVREHYRRLGGESEAETEAERQRVSDAVKNAGQQLNQAFTSVGNAIRDPEASQGLERAMSSLGLALAATFSDLGAEMKEQFSGAEGERDGPPGAGGSPPPPPASAG